MFGASRSASNIDNKYITGYSGSSGNQSTSSYNCPPCSQSAPAYFSTSASSSPTSNSPAKHSYRIDPTDIAMMLF